MHAYENYLTCLEKMKACEKCNNGCGEVAGGGMFL